MVIALRRAGTQSNDDPETLVESCVSSWQGACSPLVEACKRMSMSFDFLGVQAGALQAWRCASPQVSPVYGEMSGQED